MPNRLIAISFFLFTLLLSSQTYGNPNKSKVYLLKTSDRGAGVSYLLQASPLPDLKGKKIIIKPNFNSDDPFPATTHLDTLKAVIEAVKAKQPAGIAILERSGMGDTEKVLTSRGVYELGKKEKVEVINLERLKKERWARKGQGETHWKKGFLVPQAIYDADYVINLPCLKTHRFGGDFTLSLKNYVGLAAKWEGTYNYMWELHLSPDQRRMIAEINKYVPCHLIIMDGLQAFSTEGPEKGKLIEPGVLLLSTDRIAIDAAGVAILRIFGTTDKVSRGKIFELDQIKRAAELGVGVRNASEIEIVAVNPEAKELVEKIKSELAR